MLQFSPRRLNPFPSLPYSLFFIPSRTRNLQLSVLQNTYTHPLLHPNPSRLPPLLPRRRNNLPSSRPTRLLPHNHQLHTRSSHVPSSTTAPHRTAPHRAAYAASQPYTWSSAPHVRALPLYRRRIYTRISCLGYVRWEDTALSCVAVYGVKCMFTTMRPRGCARGRRAVPCRAAWHRKGGERRACVSTEWNGWVAWVVLDPGTGR